MQHIRYSWEKNDENYFFSKLKVFQQHYRKCRFCALFSDRQPLFLNHQKFLIYYCLIANYRKDLDTKDSLLQNKDILFFWCISNAFRNIGIQGARKSWFHLCYFANLQSILLRNFSEIDIQCHKSRQSLIENVFTYLRKESNIGVRKGLQGNTKRRTWLPLEHRPRGSWSIRNWVFSDFAPLCWQKRLKCECRTACRCGFSY